MSYFELRGLPETGRFVLTLLARRRLWGRRKTSGDLVAYVQLRAMHVTTITGWRDYTVKEGRLVY